MSVWEYKTASTTFFANNLSLASHSFFGLISCFGGRGGHLYWRPTFVVLHIIGVFGLYRPQSHNAQRSPDPMWLHFLIRKRKKEKESKYIEIKTKERKDKIEDVN